MSIQINNNGKCVIDGVEYPAVGFGTYPFKEEVCLQAVTQAVALGYRIIDTATFYRNFSPISKALKPLGRNNFYIISKVWPDSHTPEKLRTDIKLTLQQLETSYLDAYLLHWPNSKLPIEDTLHALEGLRKDKLIHHLGLSNVTMNHLLRALEVGIPISWVQVEMSPFFYDPDLLAFCKKQSIAIQAWGPLGRGRIHQDTLLEKLGKKYKKTSSQVALRWIIQHGCLPLPGSQNKKHMQENLEIFDFALSHQEMEEINRSAEVGKRERISIAKGLGFTDEFDFSYEQCWPLKAGKC